MQATQLVLLHVLMEVGVKTGGDRNAERLGYANGGDAHGTLCGNIDHVRLFFDPAFAQYKGAGESDAHLFVAR